LFAADQPAVQESDVEALEHQEGEVHPTEGP
jgi:hypothetical protein